MKKHVALALGDQMYPQFAFSAANAPMVREILSRYPEGLQKSAVMPLLDLAQRQVAGEGAHAHPPYGGWIPRSAMDHIAHVIGVPPIKVYEVASFYSMYNLEPVGKYLLQFCTTTPCALCNSGGVLAACERHLDVHVGDTTPDGLFTLVEVECLGACVNAPVVQVNDDYYEDLTPENVTTLLDDLRTGRAPSVGSLKGRRGSMPQPGPTTLKDQARKVGVA